MKETCLGTEDYLVLDDILESQGYGPIEKRQKARDISRLGLHAPRKLTGSEEGRMYANNGYASKLWLTYLKDEERFRAVGEDVGWSIITEGDDLVYTATPIPRNEDFVLEMTQRAIVNKWKVDNIPLCPCKECNARMSIYRKRGTRQYMYICKSNPRHGDKKPRFRSWDYGLPDDIKDYVKAKRLLRKAYRDRKKKQGIVPIPKAVTRKKWVIGAPYNVISSVSR
jgi:hypothetical protein